MTATDAVLLCYRGGFLGWLLVRTAIGTPAFMWAGISWESTLRLELYWLLLAVGWPIVIALQYVTATFWLDRNGLIGGSPECNNDIRAMPDLTMWLLLHYLIAISLHEFALRSWPTLFSAASKLFYLVAVPAVLIWSNNTTLPYALAGAGFGTVTGLLHAALFVVLWLPRLPDIERMLGPLLGKLRSQ